MILLTSCKLKTKNPELLICIVALHIRKVTEQVRKIAKRKTITRILNLTQGICFYKKQILYLLSALHLLHNFFPPSHSSSFQMDTLCFRLPGHGDTTLKHMDSLRSRQQFCDITIVASNNQSFKGHKVVLAACSPYLRDQFLLNPSPKLQVFIHGLRLNCNRCRHNCFMSFAFFCIFPRCQ